MKDFLGPGERIAGHSALKKRAPRIYEDTANRVFYRVIDGEVVSVHGDLAFARECDRQMQAIQARKETPERPGKNIIQ